MGVHGAAMATPLGRDGLRGGAIAIPLLVYSKVDFCRYSCNQSTLLRGLVFGLVAPLDARFIVGPLTDITIRKAIGDF